MMHQAAAPLAPALVKFTLNGKTVAARGNQTILQAAEEHGIEIPRLCYMEGMRADGNCRTCMVEIKGERVLAPSCCRYPKDGMEVTTNSARAVTSQKMSIELLLADVPETVYTLNSELDLWAKKMGVGKPRFRARPQPAKDDSHPAIEVHLDACIQCKRCVRACREEQVNDVIGYAFRGGHSKIVFDLTTRWATRRASRAASASRRVRPARWRRLAGWRPSSPTRRSTRCARTVASGVSSPTTSRTIASCSCRGRMVPPIPAGCA